MSMLWLGGRQANAIVTGNAVTASPVANTLFPTTAIYDGHPSRIFRFGSLTASPTLTFDLDMIGGQGGFETFPGSWLEEDTGTGDVTQEANLAHVQFGSFSAKFFAGTGIASLYRDVVVRSGSTTWVEAWMQTDATSVMEAVVRNQQTGNYWDGTAWSSTAKSWSSQGAGSVVFSRFVSAIAVEDYTDVGAPVTTLRFQFYNQTAASSGWLDGVTICPAVNFASIHGHNIDLRSAPALRSSIDNFVASDDLRASMTPVQPTFYTYLTTSAFASGDAIPRYWRLAFADTNSATSGAIYCGEIVLGEIVSYRGPALPLQVNYSDSQVSVPLRFGAPAVYGMAQHELRSVPLTIRCESTTERDAFMDEWRRTIGGYPVVIVPHNGDGHGDVIFGRASDLLPHNWATKSFATLSTEVTELQLPVITG